MPRLLHGLRAALCQAPGWPLARVIRDASRAAASARTMHWNCPRSSGWSHRSSDAGHRLADGGHGGHLFTHVPPPGPCEALGKEKAIYGKRTQGLSLGVRRGSGGD